MAVERERNT